jgi:hypothetical protein
MGDSAPAKSSLIRERLKGSTSAECRQIAEREMGEVVSGRRQGEGERNPEGLPEERVIYRKRFQAYQFDFRGKITFTRFDRCEFVKCTLLIDHGTEQLAFTKCVFKDCNIDKLEPDEKRALYVRDNFFDRPLDDRRAEFEKRLAEALAARKAKGK